MIAAALVALVFVVGFGSGWITRASVEGRRARRVYRDDSRWN